MNKEQAINLINDIKYTLEINKKDIVNMMLKNRTRSLNINFNIEPDSITTMELFYTKNVMSKKDLLVKKITNEK
jgi:lipopolysaccharide biosynthesis glycosyltransferase